jgi:hypothetical protein
LEPTANKPSGSAPPKSLTKTATKRKLQVGKEDDDATKKAKSSVPATTEEPKKYDFKYIINVIDSAAYDAKSKELSSLGLPEDVTKLVAKHFAELKKILKELNKAVKDKQVLENMKK